MFHATMAAAIDGARTLAQMDELSRQVWQGHGAGALTHELVLYRRALICQSVVTWYWR